ncbi:MAG: prolipoprotein diacylglyceryl transferase, partial [Candidatus Pacebacteria bacterium]|nr:prolipoprotein diacylglyceryl transferase [Candidatus Paceibacterota bacterium]MBT4681098.1 prolipoprotein diacylglyceryl transferase [Candidatus Paceibacterota bacterium]
FSSLGKKINLAMILDLSVFGLPVAQAIGRCGNFFNQELYGLPTQLPWKIYIEPAYRLIGYEQFSYFQPLFLYEMILMLLFAGGVWWGQKQSWLSGFSIGSGRLFYLYIYYYSFIRFWLDFIRIDKTHFFNTNLGLNQAFLLLVMVITICFLRKKK